MKTSKYIFDAAVVLLLLFLAASASIGAVSAASVQHNIPAQSREMHSF